MKSLEKFIYHAFAYTVIISSLFFLFAKITMNDVSISFGRYFLIVAFGFVISAAEFIFSAKRLHAALRYAIHYLVLFLAFFVIFIAVKETNTEGFGAPFIFAALIIFSVIYFAILGVALLIKSRLKGNEEKQKTPANDGKKSYTPRFRS